MSLVVDLAEGYSGASLARQLNIPLCEIPYREV